MLKAFFLALNVRREEEKQVLLLLSMGFFMGIFLATYQVSAETLFLNNLGEFLKEAILVSGLLGIIVTAIFASLQTRIPFAKLVLSSVICIFLFTSLMFLLSRLAGPVTQKYLIFLLFVMIGPILAIMLLGFWGLFGRLFDLRQSKRIIGGIDIGQLTAAIITSFSIPFLEPLIPNTVNYLLISGISMLIVFGFLFWITTEFDLEKAKVSTNNDEDLRTDFLHLSKNNYVRLLSVFLIFSMVTFTFVQYSFQNAVAQQYPDENELRNFLAFFNGSILILGLLLQTFVNERIISEYGLRISLMILPLVLVLLSVAAIVSGTIFGFTIEVGTAFIWFFLFISLSRLFNYSLRDALENPVFKLYFMPLDNRVRFDIQAKVEGVINESSRFIAGLIILGLSYISFFELIHYSYATVLILIGYFFIIGKLYNEYRNRIRIKLQYQQQSADKGLMTTGEKLITNLQGSLNTNHIGKVVFSFRLLEKMSPHLLPVHINSLMGHRSEEIREFAKMKMNELKGLSVSDRYIINVGEDSDINGKKLISSTDIIDLFQSGGITRNRLRNLCKSEQTEDRQYAAELLGNNFDDDNLSFLIELLHDNDRKVRNTAIKTAQKNYNREVLNALIDNLNDPLFNAQASNALTLIGDNALDTLDNAFYRTGQSTQTITKIVRIIGRIGGQKSMDLLWSKTEYPDKTVASQVLLALANTGFKAGINQIPRIKNAIESDITDIAWVIGAICDIAHDRPNKEIVQALEEEIRFDIDHIYMLLSMLYDVKSIQLVKENIESGTNEGLIYAIELLDVFLSEDLKQRIIPVLDELTYHEKTKKLEVYYPRTRMEPKLIFKFLLNRDFTQTNRWTKVCVIHQIGLLRYEEFAFDLIACLFNPDPLISEMAAWALHEINPGLYKENVVRISTEDKRELDKVILRTDQNSRFTRFEKIMFLRNLAAFEGILGLVTAGVADYIEEIFLHEGASLSIDEYYNDNFYIIYKGSVNMYENGEIRGSTGEGEFIGEMLTSRRYIKASFIIAVTETILFKVKKDEFYELLTDNLPLATNIFKIA